MQGIDTSAANFFTVGPLLRAVAKRCQDEGATLILVHHTGKLAGMEKVRNGAPIELTDLAYSGFAEFARQWILLSRRVRYEAGTGKHELWPNIGGSAGQSGLWGIDIDEGALSNQFTGRGWKVSVKSRTDTERALAATRDEKRRTQTETDKQKARTAVLKVLRSLAPEGETTNGIKDAVDCKKSLVGSTLLDLGRDGRVERTKVSKAGGRSGKKEYEGWKLTTHGQTSRDHAEMTEVDKIDDYQAREGKEPLQPPNLRLPVPSKRAGEPVDQPANDPQPPAVGGES